MFKIFKVKFLDESKPLEEQLKICQDLIATPYLDRLFKFTSFRMFIKHRLISIVLLINVLLFEQHMIDSAHTVKDFNMYTTLNIWLDIIIFISIILEIGRLLDFFHRLSDPVLTITTNQLNLIRENQPDANKSLERLQEKFKHTKTKESDKEE